MTGQSHEDTAHDEPEVLGFRSSGGPGPVSGAMRPPTGLLAPIGLDYDRINRDEIEVRFRPGSYAERAAPEILRRLLRAREQLRGFGSEPWGSLVAVTLVEPYADAHGDLVGAGTVVDPIRREISFIITPDTPAEDPHRALALVYGAAFPGAERNAPLIEAYGLALGETETTGDPRLDDELGFVRFLLDREGHDAFRRFLAADPERELAASREIYGASLAQLRERWAQVAQADGDERVGIVAFTRMSARYIWPYRYRQLELFFHMLLGLSFTLAFPLVTQRLLDQAIPSGSFRQVLNLLTVLGVTFVVSLAADVRRSYLHAWIGGAVTRDLRQQLYDRCQLLPTSWHRRNDQGEVLTRLFADVSQVQGGLTQVLTLGIFQALSVLVSAAVMFSINWILGAVVMVGVPVIAVVFTFLAGGAVERSKDVQANQSSLMSIAAENNRATNVVRLFGLSGRESRRFATQANRLFRSQQRLNMWMGLFAMSINLVLRILRLVALGLGAWLILEGRFTLGGLVAFLAIMGEVLNPITDLANIGQAIQGSMGSLLRINGLLSEPTEPLGTGLADLPPPTRSIDLQSVSFGYGPSVRTIDDLSCTIPIGSRVAFVGPSGSGKSTVLRLLMRIEEPETGAITVDGCDLRSCSLRSWRDRLGVVFQDSFLFDSSIRENIALGAPAATDADIIEAARLAGLADFIASSPDGLDTVVGQDGSGLSGGQRQRVAIARALVRHPAILLLDEATSALDPSTERLINQTLLTASDGRTLVSVTHRLAALPDYDHIFVLDRGSLVEQGSHGELLALGGVYAQLWAEQTGERRVEDPDLEDRCVEALAELPLFCALEGPELTEIAGLLTPMTIEAGDRISSQRELIVIVDGEADVWVGTPAAPVRLGPGDVIGMRSVMDHTTRTTIQAVSRLHARVLTEPDVATIEARFPAVAQATTGQTGQFRPTGTLLTAQRTISTPSSTHRSAEVTPEVEAVTIGAGPWSAVNQQIQHPRATTRPADEHEAP